GHAVLSRARSRPLCAGSGAGWRERRRRSGAARHVAVGRPGGGEKGVRRSAGGIGLAAAGIGLAARAYRRRRARREAEARGRATRADGAQWLARRAAATR